MEFPNSLIHLILCLIKFISAHNFLPDTDHVLRMRKFTSTPGVMTSFENSLVSGNHFIGFTGWEKLNRQYMVENISIIVRVEFDRFSYRHNRLKKTYNRYHIPGAKWVEMNERGNHYYSKSFNYTRSKNTSSLDIWVEPVCFLQNHGVSRIYRITRSLKMHVYHLRWIAKLNFNSNVSYEFKELRQFGKFLTHLPGVDCAWVHPKTDEKYSLLVKFDKHRVPSKKFFNPQGFHSWDDINSQYQVGSIAYLRGWNRALIHLESGLHCKVSSHQVAMKYKNLPGVISVFRDEYQNCRLTYRILIKFDGRFMTPKSLHFYQDWSSLNYMYGVVNISYHEDVKLIAHLEFEPGLYTNHQMKAIRSEYLKLKGVMFAWVEGLYPSGNTRIVVKFQSHINLVNYTKWNYLNTLYFSQIRSINHNRNDVVIDLPEGRYTETELKNIHKEYRNLPGALTVEPRASLTNGGHVVTVPVWRGGLMSLGNTWWVKVQEKENKEKGDDDMSNETGLFIKHTPLYHKYRNKSENSLWENHCDLH